MRHLFLILFLALPACQTLPTPDLTQPSYSLNQKKYEAIDPAASKVRVSLRDQKAWLLNQSGEPVLETDVATGTTGHETPVGIFPVLERIIDKDSNKYGKIIDTRTGAVIADRSWEFEGPLPPGAAFDGTAMPYWMRLTWDGVGMHVGSFQKLRPCSFGCIRVFEPAQPLIYDKIQKGTPVEVVSESLIPTYPSIAATSDR